MSVLETTPLDPLHRELGARMVDFAGWSMPVQYTSIVDEHHAVRKRAGLFDLCHMGRFEVRGPKAVEAVDAVTTNHVAKMKRGKIRYSLVPNEEGGVRDDILIYRMEDEPGGDQNVLLVVNASNRDKLMAWFGENLVRPGANLYDRSNELAMIAVQGPEAQSIIAPVVDTEWTESLSALGYYEITPARIRCTGEEIEGFVSRTGYTGEDGFELYVPNETAIDLWSAITDLGGDTLIPCGLGARDTLRLEAGMPLYGHELGEDLSPVAANLGFAIKAKKPNGFIGRDAIVDAQQNGTPRVLRGFTVEGRRIAREDMPIFLGDKEVGRTTSGAPSPTLEKPIAMAYVDRDVAEDAELEVGIRKTRAKLTPHAVPFYSRKR